LTRKFCQPTDGLGLKKTGKEVSLMRTYLVRVFLPQIIGIEAEDEAQALEKVAALYKEHYAEDLHDWIEPMMQPEDVQ
jgi:hypothetical protein